MLREATSETLLNHIDGDDLLARWGLGILTGGLSLVLICTLFPFNFNLTDSDFLPSTISRFYGWGNSIDWLNNIVLFIPLGLGLTCLMQKSRLGTVPKVAIVLMISAGLSVTVEILQLFLPARFSAFADIVANSIGGIVGFLFICLWKAKLLTLLLVLKKGKQQYLSLKRLTISLIGYFLIACFITLILITTGNIDSWDESFTLLIGNEHTGNRPWQGSISELVIADRAISSAEIERAFSEANFWHTLGDALIGYYQFSGQRSYQDQTGQLPDLSWRTLESQDSGYSQLPAKDYSSHDKSRVFLDSSRWLETENPSTLITRSIQSTSQFTLKATVTTANPLQTGPARIISLSGSPYARNFTLGQEQSNLIFRLRTRISGENGAGYELMIPGVFSDNEIHQIVVIYDGRYFRLYVDKAVNLYSLEMLNVAIMSPVIALRSLLSLPLDHYVTLDLGSINATAYKIFYFALIFVPMGSMIGLVALVRQGQIGTFDFLTIGWLVLPAVMLEGILASVGSSGMRLENILLNLGISIAAMLLFRRWAATWLFGQPANKRTHVEVAPTAG